MNNTILLKNINDLLALNNDSQRDKINTLLLKMRESVQLDVLTSDVGSVSDKNRMKKAATFLAKQNKIRPILNCCYYENDHQYITDSYFLADIKTKENYIITVEKTTDPAHYPTSIINIAKRFYGSMTYLKDVETKDLLNKAKAYPYIDFNLSDALIGSQLLTGALNFIKGDILKVYSDNKYTVIFENESGDHLIIIGVRSCRDFIENAVKASF